jgi:hypothetical protein
MNISQEFAPPFKLIAPFFIIGAIVYFFSTLLLFNFDTENLFSLNASTLAWVHLFLLGFVMMIIFGAMAQLIPVVLEVGHFAVDLYYVIYPLLLIGSVLMALGFIYSPILLPFGGVIAFISFFIFLFETFLTIKKVKKLNFVITTVIVANMFLLGGLIIGLIIALGYAGIINVDVFELLKSHIFLVLIGYVGITIMGMSLVLLPMFWLSHNFSWKYVKIALVILSIGIISMPISSLTNIVFFEYMAYNFSFISLLLYLYQISIIYKTRARVEVDIYFKCMAFSYINFFISLFLIMIYVLYPTQSLLLCISWLAIVGFLAFLIVGHLYKIIPFLVWYEKFSCHVGKKKVPMLGDMIPKKSANFQFIFSCFGVYIVAFGILIQNNLIFKSGVSFLLVGVCFLLKDVFYMINFKGEENV